MIRQAVLKPEAERDLAEAYAWYQRCRHGLGDDFLDEVESSLEAICRSPEQFAVAYADLRISLVRRFPYLLIFRVDPDQITVYAIYHSSRHPKGWQSRGDRE